MDTCREQWAADGEKGQPFLKGKVFVLGAYLYGIRDGIGTVTAITEWEDEQGKTYKFEHDLAEVTVTG